MPMTFLLPCEFSYWKLGELLNLKNKNQLILLAPGNHQGTTILEKYIKNLPVCIPARI